MGSERPNKTKKKLIKWITIFVLLVAVPAVYGIYNIFQPVHYPVKFFRGEVVQVTDALLLGPYPTEKEMKYLKRLGVTEIISLLDPSLPFEAPLIRQEKRLAEKNNLGFRNAPLSYLPNLESKENLDQASKLVSYLRNNSNKKYVHCYLGRHRTTLVKEHYLKEVSQTP